jgi:hypothetical protein
MRAQLSSNRWDRKKNLSPTSSTFSSDLSGVLVKLTLRRRVGFSRILEVADGCRKFAGRSANLGERIVKPALAALTLLDGLGESLMVDLDLFLLALGRSVVVVLAEILWTEGNTRSEKHQDPNQEYDLYE